MISEILKKEIAEVVSELGFEGFSDSPDGMSRVELSHPNDFSHGDFAANVAMVLAKQAGKNPVKVAGEIVEKLQEKNIEHVAKIEIAGPGFINFTLAPGFFVHEVENIVKAGEKYGSSDSFKGQTWLIEHTSPNPNKAMHLGHLRNNLTGMAIGNVSKFAGAKVILDMVDNNRGIAIAKLMWGYLKFAKKSGEETEDIAYWYEHQDEWQQPADLGMRPDRFVDSLYVKGSEDFKKCEEVEALVRDLVVKWEAGESRVRALWQTVLDFSIAGQNLTLERLGNHWDYKWHESDHYQEGKDLVSEGLEKGIFQKLDDGAILTKLESYNIPDTIVQKKDGTALYITQDLALTRLKKEKFHPDKMLWVIGPEQSLAMKQMFAVSEQLGTGKFEDFIHVPYGYMSIKGEGKMSSREGNVIYIDELIDETKEAVKEASEHVDDTLAEQVALGAIKFSILRTGRTVDMAFDMKTSISTEGDSGPYIQYTIARSNSVLEKAHEVGIQESFEKAGGEVSDVERLLYRFPEVVEISAKNWEPHHVANYALELARAFNSFYGNTKLVDAENPNAGYNLSLVQATAQVLKNCLGLLGIESPEKM